MKNTLKLIALAFIIVLGHGAFAQRGHGGHKHNADSIFSAVSARLKLTSDQQTKLKEVMKTNREEVKALREANKNKEKAEKRKAMLEQMKKSEERIKAILNDSQKLEYAKIKEEKKAQFKAKRAERQKSRPQGDADDELMDENIL